MTSPSVLADDPHRFTILSPSDDKEMKRDPPPALGATLGVDVAAKGQVRYNGGLFPTRSLAMKSNPVGWFEIYVQDMDRARAFYESMLQGQLEKLPSPGMEMWTFPMEPGSGGAGGALVKMDGVPSGGGGTLVYFACDDCAVEAGRVPESGGRMDKAKMSIGEHGFIALAFDTEGNMFGLHSMK